MRSRLTQLSVILALALAVLSPQIARADEPEPVHRYGDERRPPPPVRPKVLLTGAALTGLFYLPALGASYLYPEHHGAAQLRIPVAGPWMGVARTKLCNARDDLPNCNNFMQVFGAVLLVFDGIGQAGGTALMLQSILVPTGPSRAERSSSEVTALTERDRLLYSLESSRALTGDGPSTPLTLRTRGASVTPVPFVPTESSVGFGLVGTF